MNQKLFKDKVYLTLLAFYDEKHMPNYTALGEQIGITRQTVAKKVGKLLDEGIITINSDNIVFVKNENQINKDDLKNILETNINQDAIHIQMDLAQMSKQEINCYDVAKTLNVSPTTIYNNLNAEGIVYGIISEGIIKYVGSTKHFEERIKEHIRMRPFLDRKNFIILKRVDLNDRFNSEKQLIKILQPEWNIMSK